MREGSGLVEFSKRFPDRYFDVAIAEQHAVTFAAGLAVEGLKPIVAIYSTFLQRGYDQLIHDVALQNLPVVFALDRAGLVGSDGATHQGSYDISFLRCIPNMTIMAPADENECRQMLYTATTLPGPSAVRYPRGTGSGVALVEEMTALPIGRAQPRREGRSGLAILVFGTLLDAAQKIAERLDATLINMRFVKPLDEDLVISVAARHRATRDYRGKRDHRRRGFGGSGAASPGRGPYSDLAAGHSGSLHRAWLTRQLPGRRWTGCRGFGVEHRAVVGDADAGTRTHAIRGRRLNPGGGVPTHLVDR